MDVENAFAALTLPRPASAINNVKYYGFTPRTVSKYQFRDDDAALPGFASAIGGSVSAGACSVAARDCFIFMLRCSIKQAHIEQRPRHGRERR